MHVVIHSMNRILLPISWCYQGLLKLRHKLFDWHIIPSKAFDLPVICVGNLSLGGTGKTPHTEYLIELLGDYRLAVLSRGYGRRTKGFRLANASDSAETLGDEPMLYHLKYPEIVVAVDEDRVDGVEQLLRGQKDFPPEVIVLDDAFQHRRITAGLNLLLTEYGNLYSDDALIPAGTLRDIKSAARRADIVIVTKCPYDLPDDTLNRLRRHLKLLDHQKLFLSHLHHAPLKPLNTAAEQFLKNHQPNGTQQETVGAVCFTGIAHPEPLVRHLQEESYQVREIRFPDHHLYREKDIQHVMEEFEKMPQNEKIIVTTEKDNARLKNSPYICQFESAPLFMVPISVSIHQEEMFNNIILSYVRENHKDC